MCRADVADTAELPLAALLVDLARAIADAEGVDPGQVRIGPVDFGPEDKESPR